MSDERRMRRQLDLITARIVQLTATRARVEAERDGISDLPFPASFFAGNPRAASVAADERRLLEARRAAVDNQKALLDRRAGQLRQEIGALKAQHGARVQEAKVTRDELKLLDDMGGRQLTTIDRLMSLRRNVARHDGEIAALLWQIARTENQITDIDLQIAELDQKAILEAHREMREIDTRIDELSDRQLTVEAQLAKVAARSAEQMPVQERQNRCGVREALTGGG